ncbi:transcription termination/antitermination protein NusG [Algibacter mikhailovii]|uniref:Transcriptional regulator n=1 Tax=Algibacter mikhailovii TaxID=425498 RepID=A0A918R019_9FLAO|nr:UpxY family transcription antiterminator [Algibacter mikhailovii]GGZ78426.1 transcriptional regulator [Algibacter mikhailovii]
MEKKWFVLYVKPQNEKKIAERLLKAKIEVYCPVVKEVRVWSDRKKTIEAPLFKSYLFVRLLDKERELVFSVPGIIRYLFWLGKPAIVRNEEIDAIKHWLSDGNVESCSLSELTPGDRISIKNDLLGTRQSKAGSNQAIVQEVGKNRVRVLLEGVGMIINIKRKQIY